MRTWLLLIALPVIAAMSAGCGKGDAGMNGSAPEEIPEASQKTPSLALADSDLTIDFAQTNGTAILFEVNVDWQVTVEYEGEAAGWLAVTPESGSAGKAELTLTADANTPTPCKASIFIAYGGQIRQLTITNDTTPVSGEPVPELELHTWHYYNGFYAHETYEEKIAFTVNTDWTVAVEYDNQSTGWLTVTPDSGTAGDAELVMTVAKNPSINSRRASILISYGGKTTSAVTVDQMGLNLVCIFGRQFAEELERRGYVPSAYRITPQDVKGIKTLQMHGNWDASREVYLGKLTSLNGLEYFESLESLTCWGNQLTTLDVSHNTALKKLFCYSNQLTTLDVSKNPALRSLNCHSNQLTSIDVSHNPTLVDLACLNNQLTSLDVTNNPILTFLLCDDNQLTSLDVSRNPKLRNLDCFNNPGDGALFPVRAWFDNATIPTGMYTRFTTESWSYDGNPITIDYRKAD